ncbi:hypothetical protein ACFL0Q_02760 [Thermodesulfobacteriota bacterium]
MHTITIVTDFFAPLARSQAAALGSKDLSLLVIPHPLGGLKGPEVLELGNVAFEKLLNSTRESDAEKGAHPGLDEMPVEESLSFAGAQEAYDCFNRRGWTDGLPIVLPTERLVETFLERIDKEPEDTLGIMPPRWAQVTFKKIAINAAMAGCLPEYFPVILSAVEATLDENFNLNAIQTTTHPCAVMLIINGPVRKELNINAKHNCFGQGCRANATIGRAVRLVLLNVGGGIPGSMDKATMGHPGKYSYCVAENQEESPWSSFHVEKGYSPDASTVTVVAAEPPHNINDHGSVSAEGILTTVAGTMATTGNNNLYNCADTFVFFGPEHAATIARDGYGKDDVRRFLFERARIPVSRMSQKQLEHIQAMLRDPSGFIDENRTIGICREMSDLHILVSGGAGKHSAWVPTFGFSYSATRTV